MTGRIEALWLKPKKGEPVVAVERARMVAGRGLDGNADHGGQRQVTVIEREAWQAAARQLDAPLPPELRCANVLVSGLDLKESRGRVLMLGGCRLVVGGETKPCRHMDSQHPGLKAALTPEWRGGVYGRVLDDGEIAVGDPVTWAEAEEVERCIERCWS